MLDDVGAGDESSVSGEEIDDVAHREVGSTVAHRKDGPVERELVDHAALSIRRGHRRCSIKPLIRAAGIEVQRDRMHVAR